MKLSVPPAPSLAARGASERGYFQLGCPNALLLVKEIPLFLWAITIKKGVISFIWTTYLRRSMKKLKMADFKM